MERLCFSTVRWGTGTATTEYSKGPGVFLGARPARGWRNAVHRQSATALPGWFVRADWQGQECDPGRRGCRVPIAPREMPPGRVRTKMNGAPREPASTP